ncbi:MAG: hypothetical protein HC906_02585 [Bacteroidales bacterium]|nr:hypothetical protein [Bacteroidales bacterium]
MAMTYNGSNGDTRTAMENTLKKSGLTIEEINMAYKELMQGLTSVDPKVILNIANSIWYREDFYVLPDFLQINTDYFESEVNALDFSNPASIDIINDWVSQKTNNKIETIIDQIPSEAVMYLINAIYFNGIWKYEFKKEDTHLQEFFPEGVASYQTPMMHLTDSVNFFSNDLFSSIELPYGNGHYSMFFYLPKSGKTVDDVVSSLSPETWSDWLNSYTKEKVSVSIPKFKFEFEDTLNNELTSMGMGIAFTGQADFSKINPEYDLYISMVKQKAYVDVNEKALRLPPV